MAEVSECEAQLVSEILLKLKGDNGEDRLNSPLEKHRDKLNSFENNGELLATLERESGVPQNLPQFGNISGYTLLFGAGNVEEAYRTSRDDRNEAVLPWLSGVVFVTVLFNFIALWFLDSDGPDTECFQTGGTVGDGLRFTLNTSIMVGPMLTSYAHVIRILRPIRAIVLDLTFLSTHLAALARVMVTFWSSKEDDLLEGHCWAQDVFLIGVALALPIGYAQVGSKSVVVYIMQIGSLATVVGAFFRCQYSSVCPMDISVSGYVNCIALWLPSSATCYFSLRADRKLFWERVLRACVAEISNANQVPAAFAYDVDSVNACLGLSILRSSEQPSTSTEAERDGRDQTRPKPSKRPRTVSAKFRETFKRNKKQVVPEDEVEAEAQSSTEKEATVKKEPLSLVLQHLLPPVAGKLTKYLPGIWEPPEGFGPEVTGKDSFYWALWWLWRAQRTKFLQCIVIIMGQGFTSFMVPATSQNIFDKQLENGTLMGLLLAVGLLGILYIVENELDFRLQQYTPAGGKFVPDTRQAIIFHLAALPATKKYLHDHQEVLRILQEDVEKLNDAIRSTVDVFSSIVRLLCIFIVLLQFNIYLNSIVFLTLPILVYYIRKKSPVIMAWSEIQLEETRGFMKSAA
ncbi:hypothetical protein CYMTET_53560, partial [Cymbomonas tetramitiformis]|eukprot:gene14656-17316_t